MCVHLSNFKQFHYFQHGIYKLLCIYRVVPPDDEQLAWLKHAEVNYWNKLKENNTTKYQFHTDLPIASQHKQYIQQICFT